jgi:small subunit ribosomal protein S20
MPNIPSAAKRARQALKLRAANRSAKSDIHTKRRAFQAVAAAKDKDKAMQLFRELASSLDKAVKRGHLKKNTADRSKSRASALLAKMA